MRPGMTGLAQVNGRNSIGWEKKIALDLAYLRDHSLLLDLAIMAKTVPVVFFRARRDKAAGEALCPSRVLPRLPRPLTLFAAMVVPAAIYPTTSRLRATRPSG